MSGLHESVTLEIVRQPRAAAAWSNVDADLLARSGATLEAQVVPDQNMPGS